MHTLKQNNFLNRILVLKGIHVTVFGWTMERSKQLILFNIISRREHISHILKQHNLNHKVPHCYLSGVHEWACLVTKGIKTTTPIQMKN